MIRSHTFSKVLHVAFVLFTFACEIDVLAQQADPKSRSLDAQLERAAWTGSFVDVKRLLEEGADANASLRRGLSTPLLRASNEGRLDVMKLLIEHGANVNHEAPDGRTPLSEAAMHRSVNPLKLLLKAGAKPTSAAFCNACFMNRSPLEKVQLLIEVGGSASDGMSGAGFAGNLEVLKLLLASDAKINAQDKNANTALHGAISTGKPEIVRFLLSKGADINLAGQSGNTPLHRAVQSGDTELLKLLLENNADVSKRNDEFVSPTRMAAMRNHEPFYKLLVQASGGEERFEPIDPMYRSGKTIDELLSVATAKFATPEEYQACIKATHGLLSYGAEAAKPVARAIRENPNNGQLHKVLVKLGPQAKDVLPMFEEMLSDKETVTIALATIPCMVPGYFEQLPDSTKQHADKALLAAVMDSNSIEHPATYFAGHLSEEAALTLLESHKPHLQEVAASIASTKPGTELAKRVAKHQLSIGKDENADLHDREKAISWLGRRRDVDPRAIELFWEILRDTPTPVPNLRGEQQTLQSRRQHFVSATARYLGQALTKDQLNRLLPLLNGDDEHLRVRAMESLQNVRPALFPSVIEWLQHEDPAIANAASVALGKRSKRFLLNPLLQSLERFNERGKVYAVLAIDNFHALEAKDKLFEIANNTSSSISLRSAAATALLGMTSKLSPAEKQDVLKGLALFARCVEDDNSPVRYRFLSQLRMLGKDGVAALPVLKTYLRENPLPEYDDDPTRWHELYPIQQAIIRLEGAVE